MALWGELKRRNVVRVAIAYAVVGWLLIEIAATVFPIVQLPDWTVTFVTMLLILGFPVALVLSWAYEITPDGTARDIDLRRQSGTAASMGRKIDFAIIGALALALGLVVVDNYFLTDDAAGVLPNSVAVLPFENLSMDPENAFFAAGIHDTILNELAKIADLNVIARTSVLQYADSQTPIAQIAEELNVGTVMEGTVQYADDQVRITAQLIDPESGAHLWSGNYDRDFADIFSIQSEIASRIAMALEAELLPSERANIERIPTVSPQAYALYLKALANVPNIAPFSPSEFFVALNQAIVLDPDFALAHATLAFAYGRALTFVDSKELAGSMEAHEALIRDHAQAALRSDPNQGLAHAALATLEAAYHRLEAARAHWTQAIEVSPNDVDVLDDAAIFYAYTDQVDEASRLLERIHELDPVVEGGAAYYIRMINGDYRGAAAIFRSVIPIVPVEWEMNKFLYTEVGLNDALAGDSELAVEALRLAEQYEPGTSPLLISRIAYAYSRAGYPREAARLVENFFDVATDEGYSETVPSIGWVFAYLAFGDRGRALDWLRTVADDPGARAGGMEPILDIAKNIVADPVLDQPEFLELRSRIQFIE